MAWVILHLHYFCYVLNISLWYDMHIVNVDKNIFAASL